jgi:hypothetical protein
MIKMKFNYKKLGIVLFLLLTVIGFSCSSVNAKYENDWQMPVLFIGGTCDRLTVYSSTDEEFNPYNGKNEYAHCSCEKEKRWTWLAMNNDIKVILVEGNYSNDESQYYWDSKLTSDEWGNDITNIDQLMVYSHKNYYPFVQLYLKNGTIIYKGY